MTCDLNAAFIKSVRLAAIGFVATAIAGCTKPYDPPILEPLGFEQVNPELESFYGLKKLAKLSEDGVRVLWAHGMCSHDKRWINHRLAAISSAMSIKPDDDVTTEGRVTTYKIGNMTIDFFLWSQLTKSIKQKLTFDSTPNEENPSGQFPYQRASLNEQIKIQLLNDCLADVAIYLGPRGEKIRKAARSALCRSLGGTYSPSNESKSNWCENLQNKNVVLITESLGSQIIYRELVSLMEYKEEKLRLLQSQGEEHQDQPEFNQPYFRMTLMDRAMLSEVTATTHFLISNQIPL